MHDPVSHHVAHVLAGRPLRGAPVLKAFESGRHRIHGVVEVAQNGGGVS